MHPDTRDRRASNGSAKERERTRVTLQSNDCSGGATAVDTVASVTARSTPIDMTGVDRRGPTRHRGALKRVICRCRGAGRSSTRTHRDCDG